ncbi:polysaccharide lyase family 7 protein [Winogradskyella sp.]|uniref:polysaccharide lyase family 7 protein n=1 Tax=Winogradskyella sp. TaxID=1883156 RepID=UPI003BA8A482
MKINHILFFMISLLVVNCSDNPESDSPNSNGSSSIDDTNDNPDDPVDASVYADVDFSNWKVTLPVDEDSNGKPDEYQPNQLDNYGYQTLAPVQPFMYDDTSDQSLVFYCFQGGATTTNSSYPRTELRELINPNNSKENWTLLEGGEMIGSLKVDSVSTNDTSSDDYHKVIVMQIHGIISEEDMETYDLSGNNGPPLIKIYWKDGYVWSHKKSLANESTSGFDLYDVYNGTWTDVKVNLGYVGYDTFEFRITASDARIEVQLNDNDPYIYQDISLEKWPFENYFKAGNYLTSTDENAFSYVKYFNLNIAH